MASLKTKFSVGLFLICGIAVTIVAVIWLGMSNYLEKGRLVVAYFDESVQGLDVDSPVKYRGVGICRVHQIIVAPDQRMIEVVMMIDSDIQTKYKSEDFIAQLKSVGITGLMFIEIEHRGDIVPRVAPPFDFTPEYPVIATQASEISKIFQGIQDTFEMFRSFDATAISAQLTSALKKVNRAIDEAKLEQTVAEFRTTLKRAQDLLKTEEVAVLLASLEETSGSINRMATNANDGISDLRATVQRLDSTIGSSGEDVQQMTSNLKDAAGQVKEAMASAATLMKNADRQVDTLQRQVVMTLNHVDRATESLNRFLDHIGNQPTQVVFSRPSEDKPLAPKK